MDDSSAPHGEYPQASQARKQPRARRGPRDRRREKRIARQDAPSPPSPRAPTTDTTDNPAISPLLLAPQQAPLKDITGKPSQSQGGVPAPQIYITAPTPAPPSTTITTGKTAPKPAAPTTRRMLTKPIYVDSGMQTDPEKEAPPPPQPDWPYRMPRSHLLLKKSLMQRRRLPRPAEQESKDVEMKDGQEDTAGTHPDA